MAVINTNITSLIGQQNLNKSQSALQTAMERLSSGSRINSAKDDAAGQAIANRMSSQITGLAQAQRNANDGISVAHTTEGALNQVNDNLQRIRELTVQSQNGTNSAEDLESIQNEIGQRLDEINRISEETSFNGVKVLASDNALEIQVGANDGEAITLNLQQINAETLGLTGFNVDGSGEVDNEAATADSLDLAGFEAGATNANGSVTYSMDTTTDNAQMTSADLMANIDDGATVTLNSTSATGYQNTADANISFNGLSLAYSEANDNFTYDVSGTSASSVGSNLTPGAGEGPASATVSIGGDATEVRINEDGSLTNTNGEALYIDRNGNLTANTSGTAGTDYVDATVDNLTAAMAGADTDDTVLGSMTLNATSEISSATITMSDSGTVYAGTDDAGIDVTGAVASRESVASMLSASGGDVALASGLTATDNLGADQTISNFTVEADGSVTANGSAGGALADGDTIYVDGNGAFTEATETTTTTTYYAQENGMVTDDTGAQVYVDQEGGLTMEAVTAGERTEDPLATLDAALKTVDSLRSDLGAIQNRFDSAITNLNTTTTNLSAARSRIEDADYAVEVSNMTRAQILQQAGTSVLAQANQVPQSVLSLLQ